MNIYNIDPLAYYMNSSVTEASTWGDPPSQRSRGPEMK